MLTLAILTYASFALTLTVPMVALVLAR